MKKIAYLLIVAAFSLGFLSCPNAVLPDFADSTVNASLSGLVSVPGQSLELSPTTSEVSSAVGTYVFQDLGTLGGTHSYAEDINDYGHIAGQAHTAEGDSHAVIWTQEGGMIDLGTLGASWSEAVAINNSDQIVGISGILGRAWRGFLWTQDDGMVDLGTLGGANSEAWRINDVGQVAGQSENASGDLHAFLWTPEEGMIDLGTLGGPTSIVYDMNNLGEVVGVSDTATGDQHAFFWSQASGMVDLGTLGGSRSLARAVNDLGQVVGTSGVAPDSSIDIHSFVWTQQDGMSDLGNFGGIQTQVYDINNLGQAVGTGRTVTNNSLAFVWTLETGMVDLGTLGGPSSTAWDVNDLGQIVGYSNTDGGTSHSFIWTEEGGMVDLYTPGDRASNGNAVNELGQVMGNSTILEGPIWPRLAVLWEPDRDGDGVADLRDNCIGTANPSQQDTDTDGSGDLCDSCPADPMDLCDPDGSAAEEITAEDGGILQTPDGSLTIDFDPGDLSEDTTISITQTAHDDPGVDILIGPSPGLGVAVAVYTLEPDGLVFDSPVSVTLRVDVTALNAQQRDRLGLYRWDESQGSFVLVPGASCNISEEPPGTFIKTCTVLLDHFSVYATVISFADAEGFKNKGQYLSYVARAANELKRAGFITGKEKGMIQRRAAVADIP